MVLISFLLFFTLSLNSSQLFAQAHPGYEKFNFSKIDEAEALFVRKRYEESLEKFKGILKSEEGTSYIFRIMLKAWNAKGELDNAEKFLKNYQASNKDSSHIWYAFGYLNYLKESYPAAEKNFERAIQINPKNGLAWNNWGAILSEKKQFVVAVEKVQRAIKADPKEPIFIWNLHKIYLEMGEPKRFENDYKNLLEQNSKQLAWGYGKILVRVIRQKAFGSYSKGELDKAILGFEDMLEIYQEIGDVKGQVPALFSLGLLNEEKGNVQKAQKFFARVLVINPNHIQAREKIRPLD
ncbi:MAG: tetratricopeptide repeat protein [Nitrospina sp.]|jgi:tetratricopeptide (TPR) repeat protein|nr:tetratricopeptide repeat protein [Nitrospina sp.]MBT6717399.1 tetratricopeptide repeat protein [Nitrospina sp.]